MSNQEKITAFKTALKTHDIWVNGTLCNGLIVKMHTGKKEVYIQRIILEGKEVMLPLNYATPKKTLDAFIDKIGGAV